jgi:hypothetical protein
VAVDGELVSEKINFCEILISLLCGMAFKAKAFVAKHSR